jgi:hypothetical protein
MVFFNALQNLNATKARHGQIGKNRVVSLNFKILERLLSAVGCMTFVDVTEKIIEVSENKAIIIN